MVYPRLNYDPVPKKVEHLYQDRIRQFTDPNGQYSGLNLPAFYDRARVHDDSGNVSLQVWSPPGTERPLFKDALAQAAGQWRDARIGDWFGPSWSTHWFKVSIKVPGSWVSDFKDGPIFDWDSSDEALVYLEDGFVVTALNAEHNRSEWLLPPAFTDGEWHTFYVETACNNITGLGSPPDMQRSFRLNRADLVVPWQGPRALYIDFWIIGDAARELPGTSPQKWKAFEVLNRIIDTFDRNNVDESVTKCRRIAQEILGPDIDSTQVYKSGDDGLVWAVGNCHIDTAWLWPYAETRRKIARSWASQLGLLDRYPEYVFAASQAVQFSWLKHDYPELFERIQYAVREGRFIPIGGSWVECDTNMPSGEALCRQLILGQRLFEREFGVRSEVFWLPDTFGYSSQLPQICRLAGMPFFLTQKLSWSNINTFPHTTFNWVGLDGSQVVCHMPPANTYTAQAHFGDVRRSQENHKNLDTEQHSLMLYGYGDGGGGPIAEMIEKLRRCRGLSDTSGGLPRINSGRNNTPIDFYRTVLHNSHDGKDLVTWTGELYLEYHRGTYTTQAGIKQSNRRTEILLRDIELVATAASLKVTGYKYPYAEIEALWQKVCLNQFHDVLPGSGIEMIYKDAHKIYAEVFRDGSKLVRTALKSLGYDVDDPEHSGDGYLLHALDFDVDMNSQSTFAPLVEQSGAEDRVLENANFAVKFNAEGLLSSIWDKRKDREVLAGTSNRLVLFEDQPQNFPAWDTEQYATDKRVDLTPTRVEAVKDGVKLYYDVLGEKSRALQIVRLRDDWIEVETDVDWHETYQFLKVEFVVDVRSPVASYETQFGVQQRPTHFNTSWDAAKFEVCGHRFADLSEYGYGVGLLTDSKYGYSIHGNRMRASLLRSPKSPDAHADMGHHHFRYALAPHNGGLGPLTVQQAARFNHPGHWVKGKKRDPHIPHVVVARGDASIFISAVKRADRDAEDASRRRIIVRVYEALGGKARGHLACLLPVKRAKRVTLLEDDIPDGELDVLSQLDADSVPVSLNPFEVQTYLIEFS